MIWSSTCWCTVGLRIGHSDSTRRSRLRGIMSADELLGTAERKILDKLNIGAGAEIAEIEAESDEDAPIDVVPVEF